MSINISLNSLINGGNTSIKIANIINDIANRTINNDKILGSLKNFCILLLKLQTTFDITNEQIIKRRKSLKVHIIKKLIKTTDNLK